MDLTIFISVCGTKFNNVCGTNNTPKKHHDIFHIQSECEKYQGKFRGILSVRHTLLWIRMLLSMTTQILK